MPKMTQEQEAQFNNAVANIREAIETDNPPEFYTAEDVLGSIGRAVHERKIAENPELVTGTRKGGSRVGPLPEDGAVEGAMPLDLLAALGGLFSAQTDGDDSDDDEGDDL